MPLFYVQFRRFSTIIDLLIGRGHRKPPWTLMRVSYVDFHQICAQKQQNIGLLEIQREVLFVESKPD